jgi:hypothetical protein
VATLTLRLSEEQLDRLRREAEANERSMQREILFRLFRLSGIAASEAISRGLDSPPRDAGGQNGK